MQSPLLKVLINTIFVIILWNFRQSYISLPTNPAIRIKYQLINITIFIYIEWLPTQPHFFFPEDIHRVNTINEAVIFIFFEFNNDDQPKNAINLGHADKKTPLFLLFRWIPLGLWRLGPTFLCYLDRNNSTSILEAP